MGFWDTLGYIGDSLDKATGSRALRGTLAGKPRELLSVVPFSDRLGLTDERDITSGRNLTDAAGITSAGDSGMIEYGAVNYASDVTPWTDPANGDFRISLSAAKNAGRGSFIETSSSYAGTIGYPDIGAVQHQDSGGSGGGGNPIGLGTVIKGVL